LLNEINVLVYGNDDAPRTSLAVKAANEAKTLFFMSRVRTGPSDERETRTI
jgi:hypothetical protein